ncbi:hypothetical protein TNCV_5059111 [Trichonephila clavipes]|nr:hypothetical protein TNCV_5059111 [Trichonephila clavipes]
MTLTKSSACWNCLRWMQHDILCPYKCSVREENLLHNDLPSRILLILWVVVLFFPKGRKESCQSLRQVGFLGVFLSLAVTLSTIQVTVRFLACLHPNFEREHPEGSGVSHLSSSSTNITRGLAARSLFRLPPYHKSTIHLQTSMTSPEFEPRPYGTAVNVTNHYTGWVTYVCYFPYILLEVRRKSAHLI